MASCAELAARQPSFAAERSECEGRDWRNLIAVVKRAMPVIKTAIEEVGRERSVLFTDSVCSRAMISSISSIGCVRAPCASGRGAP